LLTSFYQQDALKREKDKEEARLAQLQALEKEEEKHQKELEKERERKRLEREEERKKQELEDQRKAEERRKRLEKLKINK
jgi:hypothetical protein